MTITIAPRAQAISWTLHSQVSMLVVVVGNRAGGGVSETRAGVLGGNSGDWGASTHGTTPVDDDVQHSFSGRVLCFLFALTRSIC